MSTATNGEENPPRRIYPRDVWTILWVATLFLIGLFLLWELRRVIVWLLVAVFFAAVLSPLVKFLVDRGVRRGLAVGIVTVAIVVLVAGLLFAFIQPLVDQAQEFAENLPETIEHVREAPVVERFVERFNLDQRIDQVSEDVPQRLLGASGPVLAVFKTVGGAIIGFVTIFVLTIFLLLYGPGFMQAGLERINNRARRSEVRELSHDVLRAVSGWVAGNVLTSVIAGVASLIVFAIIGLPYLVLLALWVAFADLIPLVGATLGALPAIIVALIDGGITTGVIVTIFFVVYQQFENHVLQPIVYGKTIQLNPFVVLIAVIIGVELAGFLGAMFALPVAGTIQVLINHFVGAPESRGEDAPVPAES